MAITNFSKSIDLYCIYAGIGPILLLEPAAGAQQVARHADKLLRFLKGAQIEQVDLDIAVLALDAVLLIVAHGGQLAFQRVTVDEYLVRTGEVARYNH